MEREELLQKKINNYKQQIPFSKQKPQLFIWKRLALILGILISVVFVIDILMLIYLDNHPEAPVNLTFVNKIITQSKIIQSRQNIKNLMSLMAKSNPTIKYQYAELLKGGNGYEFTYQNVVENVLASGYDNLFYLFQLAQGSPKEETRSIIGVYIPEPFKVPKTKPDNDEDKPIDQKLEYYTFQYGNSREATLFGFGQPLSSNQFEADNSTFNGYFLKNNATQDQNLDLLHCKTYRMVKQDKFLSLFQILKINLSFNTTQNIENSPQIQNEELFPLFKSFEERIVANVKINLGTKQRQIYQCYDKVKSQNQLKQQLNNLFDNIDVQSSEQIRVNKFQIYELKNL